MDPQQVAESLKTDPVYIDEAAVSTLDPRLLEKAEAKAKDLDFDVYIIGVKDDYIDRDLLQQIKVFNGSEGAFIMINGTSELAVDQNIKDHELNLQVMDQMSNARDEWEVTTPSLTKLNILLDLYADPQPRKEDAAETVQEAPGGEVVQDTGSGSFAPLFLGGSILVLALVIAGIFLARSVREKARQARREKQFRLPASMLNRVDSLQRDTLRETINADTTDIAEAIEKLQTSSLDEDDAEKVGRALDAYQLARTIVDDTDSARIDLAGAMVLLRQAGREIAEVEATSAKSGRGSSRPKKRAVGLPQSLCTVNPLHGEAQSTSRVDADGKSIRVPVCGNCLADLNAGNQLQWIFDGDAPYVEVTSVWSRTLFGAIGGDLVTALHRQRGD